MKSSGLLTTSLFACCLWTAIAQALALEDQLDWLSWKQQYNKGYSSRTSELIHREIWQRNKEYVQNHNRRQDVSFQLELNQFADQQVKKQPHLNDLEPQENEYLRSSDDSLLYQPTSWDWRQKGAVTPVKNQGALADSLAIVTEECVESYFFIKTGKLITLSAAEVTDCCTHPPVVSPDAFQCVHNIGGLCSAAAYPSVKGRCMNNSCIATAQVDGGKRVPKGDEKALQEAVYKTPVMAVIDAGHASFQLYRSGIYSDPQCSTTRLDHAVQIVGYGSLGGVDYWICKNSWGVSWGMEGYILIARNKGNMCGIASLASYPV